MATEVNNEGFFFLHYQYVTFNKASATQNNQPPAEEENRGKPHMKRTYVLLQRQKSQLLHICHEIHNVVKKDLYLYSTSKLNSLKPFHMPLFKSFLLYSHRFIIRHRS